MKKFNFLKCTLALTAGFAFVSCGDISKEAVKITMSPQTKAAFEKMKAEKSNILSEEEFPAVLEELKKRSPEQLLPEVNVTHEIGLEKYSTGNVCTLNKDNYKNIIFYIHGGSFTFEISHLHVEFCDLLADPLNAKVYMPLYPLCPQATYKETYAMLHEVYDDLLKQNKPIYIMGDSAGGALTLSMCQQIKAEGKPMPEKMVLIGPFVDASMTNPEIAEIIPKDATLRVYGLVETGKLWGTGCAEKDPLVYPIYGEMKDLPDTLLFNSTCEVLYPDGKKLYRQMKSAGTRIQWVIGEGFWHVFPIYNIPERQPCADMIVDFVRKSN